VIKAADDEQGQLQEIDFSFLLLSMACGGYSVVSLLLGSIAGNSSEQY
jgi:hypothetical protein